MEIHVRRSPGHAHRRQLLLRKGFSYFASIVISLTCLLLWWRLFILSPPQQAWPFAPDENRANQQSSSISSESFPRSPVIAYVISFIKCGDHQSTVAGMMDAIAVLRHSVHLHSIRHRHHHHSRTTTTTTKLSSSPLSSRYDYQFYALVHQQAVHDCQADQLLSQLGITVLVRDTPVRLDEIQSDTLRNKVPRAWCCGHAEFIKLYAYTLTQHPLVVHMDVDFLLTRPMDVVFDAMLFSPDSPRGRAARHAVPLEFPREAKQSWLSSTIPTAMMTRDWGQVSPGRKPGYQAGFLVIRPDIQVFEALRHTIRTADYVDGFSRRNGWGGKGYGSFVGAEAMQGLLAYYYDVIAPPGSWIELNACRFNHMGMDMLYRANPNFLRKHKKVGKCRNDRDYCEDCQTTPVSEIYSIHYTQCRKPWACVAESKWVRGSTGIPEDNVLLPHCLELATVWHSYRHDLETQVRSLMDETSVANIKKHHNGTYFPHVFQGHCRDYGSENYIPLTVNPNVIRLIPKLYQ